MSQGEETPVNVPVPRPMVLCNLRDMKPRSSLGWNFVPKWNPRMAGGRDPIRLLVYQGAAPQPKTLTWITSDRLALGLSRSQHRSKKPGIFYATFGKHTGAHYPQGKALHGLVHAQIQPRVRRPQDYRFFLILAMIIRPSSKNRRRSYSMPVITSSL